MSGPRAVLGEVRHNDGQHGGERLWQWSDDQDYAFDDSLLRGASELASVVRPPPGLASIHAAGSRACNLGSWAGILWASVARPRRR